MTPSWTLTDLVDPAALSPEGHAQAAVILDGLAKGLVSHYEATEMIACSGLSIASSMVAHRIDIAA